MESNKYSSEQLKKYIDDALNSELDDKSLIRNNINEMVEQISIYHQELQYQNAELSQAVSQLEMLKEKYQALFSDAPVGYVVFDCNDNILEANNTFCLMMNLRNHEANRHKFTEFILPHYQDSFYFFKNHVLREKKQKSIDIQIRSLSKIYDVSVICKPFYYRPVNHFSPEGNCGFICCAIMDISEIKRQQEKIIDMSYHDAMTGLYNRRFFSYITRKLKDDEVLPLTIATVDLDGLKIINDTLGHEYGDKAIHIVCDTLKSKAEANYILIRMGGDEVVVLCPKVRKELVDSYMDSCVTCIRAQNIEGIPLSISYGVATKTKKQETISSVTALSEDIMYSHKIMQSPKQKNLVVRQTINRLFEKHPNIQHHSERVRDMMVDFAKFLKLPADLAEHAEKLGHFHDIGLIAVADALVMNDEDFNEEELQEYQRHSQIGNRIIRSLFGFEEVATAALYHHEWWDGNGYPFHIKGDRIPFLSRMLSLVDRYDWLYFNQKRSYQEVYEKMVKERGTRFDPTLFDQFLLYLKTSDYAKRDNMI